MTKDESPTREELLRQNAELQCRLHEAQEALSTYQRGEVDAFVVSTEGGDRVYALEGANHAYRMRVETMNEGAAALGKDGSVLYCNQRLAALLQRPLEKVMGSCFTDYIRREERATWEALWARGVQSNSKGELHLHTETGLSLPVQLSLSSSPQGGQAEGCLVATDLTEQKQNQEIVAAEQLARSILEQATEAIVVCDTSERIIRSNRNPWI